MLTTVKLYGVLGKEFGKEHKFDIKKPAEAIQALLANNDRFESVLVSLEYGVKVLQEEEPLFEFDDFHKPMSGETIKIIPIIAGSDWKDWALIIAGVVLIAISWGGYAPLSGPMFGIQGAMSWGQAIGMMGISLVFQGVAGLLFAPPEMDDSGETSYAFGGPVNTTKQGNVVPVGYGTLWVGSQVISGGFYAENILTS